MVPFTMAAFLLAVKVMSIFRSQYRKGLPAKIAFLPSFFIVIPIATLLAITLFRYGHFFDHQLQCLDQVRPGAHGLHAQALAAMARGATDEEACSHADLRRSAHGGGRWLR